MSSVVRRIVFAIAIVAVALLAHWPLFRAGWLGDDFPLLRAAAAEPASTAEHLGWLDGGRVRPIHGGLLLAHARLFGEQGAFALENARALRILSLAALLAAGAALGFALRRALLPWLDDASARAAGWAAALLAAAHPLGTAAIARPSALGDLVALALAGAAAALFLRGRQQGRKRFITLAAALAVLAGFASSLALLLAPVLAVLEFTSGRRPRPLTVRVRTAATTLGVFAACALLESFVAVASGLPERRDFASALPAIFGGGDLELSARACVEKLGVIFLPVPTRGEPDARLGASLMPAYLTCVAIAFLALWPALRAARSAPRLWGRLCAAWLVVIAIALVPHKSERVVPGDSSHAEILICAALFASLGLATAATALSGARRVWIPLVMALAYAWLGSSAALPWVRATHEVELLRADIDRAYATGSTGSLHVLVVDPPTRAAGLDLGLADLALLVDPHLRARAATVRSIEAIEAIEDRSVRSVARDALSALARQPEFDAWRHDGLVLVLPERGADGMRSVQRIPATVGSRTPERWRGESKLFELGVDPSSLHFARLTAMPDRSTAEAPQIGWLGWRSESAGGEPGGEIGSATGVWLAAEGGAEAVFDLSRSMDWWTSRTVRRLAPKGELLTVALAELLPELPIDLDGEAPRPLDTDWTFRLGSNGAPKLMRGDVRFVLTLLDVESLAWTEIACERAGSDIRARGATTFERAHRRAPGALAWSLECRAGDAVVARSSGRR